MYISFYYIWSNIQANYVQQQSDQRKPSDHHPQTP